MPAITLHPPTKDRPASNTPSSLPQLLHTPSGLAILEIQGTINTPAATGSGEPAAVGHLTYPLYNPALNGEEDLGWMKRVYLYVGKHQRMTGEVKKLGQPIAVIRKKGQGEDLEIAEIVRYKVLFAHRPEPVGAGGGEEGGEGDGE